MANYIRFFFEFMTKLQFKITSNYKLYLCSRLILRYNFIPKMAEHSLQSHKEGIALKTNQKCRKCNVQGGPKSGPFLEVYNSCI